MLIKKISFYYYSNKDVAEYIEEQTSLYCTICNEIHDTLNNLRKHLDKIHKRSFWYLISKIVIFVWITSDVL
jgi:hypothetical protein